MVDAGGVVNPDSASIARDENGALHFGYQWHSKYEARYANNLAGSWSVEIIDGAGTILDPINIAIDNMGNLYASYFDDYTNNRYCANNKGGSWSVDAVDNYNSFDRPAGIAVDDRDHVHLVHHNGDCLCLKYATERLGAWFDRVIDYDAGSAEDLSMVLDPDGHAHVIYVQDYFFENTQTQLRYATNQKNGLSWQIFTVEGAVDGAGPIALDGQGNIHVSYVADMTLWRMTFPIGYFSEM